VLWVCQASYQHSRPLAASLDEQNEELSFA
jgi:hypothetical protein